jgi:N6-adenosine-specific RNA methylase IME4
MTVTHTCTFVHVQCTITNVAIIKNICDVTDARYDIVYADPPWSYYGDPNKDQAAGKHYKTMTDDEISAMPVRSIMAPRSCAFVWATSSKLESAIDVINAWDLCYRGVFQVWVKTNRAGKVINGQGVRPSYTKPTVEYLLVASTHMKGRTFPILTEAMENVVMATRPNNIHSKKPAVFRDNITKLLGDRKRIELFARESIEGWDAWGNDVNDAQIHDVDLSRVV